MDFWLRAMTHVSYLLLMFGPSWPCDAQGAGGGMTWGDHDLAGGRRPSSALHFAHILGTLGHVWFIGVPPNGEGDK